MVRPVIASGIRIIATRPAINQSLDISRIDPLVAMKLCITAVPFRAADTPH